MTGVNSSEQDWFADNSEQDWFADNRELFGRFEQLTDVVNTMGWGNLDLLGVSMRDIEEALRILSTENT